MVSGSWWNYYRDEVNYDAHEKNAASNYRINQNTKISKPFEYKTKLTGSVPVGNSMLEAETAVPLKYVSNFWRSDLPLIKCERDLELRWSKNCVISEISRTAAVAGDNIVEETITTSAIFQITLNFMSLKLIRVSTEPRKPG